MLYLFLALAAQVLNALVVLADKYLIASKLVVKPVVYAFLIAVLSGVVIVILPFGVVVTPTVAIIFLSLAVSFAYVFSILFLYKSLAVSDASDVAPILGAVSALSALLFNHLFLGGHPVGNFLGGFTFLVVGTVLMSYFRFSGRSLAYVIFSGMLFGLSSVLVKMIFLETTFWNGFFWSRMGNVVAALIFLIPSANRRVIFNNILSLSFKTKFFILANKTLAGFAFLLILLAINLGDVSVVNAIGGVQFVILIIFALIFSKKFPDYFYESVSNRMTIVQKVGATILVSTGYVLLFI
ncbi:MAG: DMT family transporter [Candidatus Yanofskybacteria bacterium]|nr:DMT family transporter [Candidatus Yanofskybacteria bacterium]